MKRGCKSKKGKLHGKNSLKASRRREDEGGATDSGTAIRTQTDEGMKTKSVNCFNTWVHICNEADESHESKSLQEEELKQCFGRHKLPWEPTPRETEVIAEKAFQLSQSSKSQRAEFGTLHLGQGKRLGKRQKRNDQVLD